MVEFTGVKTNKAPDIGQNFDAMDRGHVTDRQWWIYEVGAKRFYYHMAFPAGALGGLNGYANAHAKAKEKNNFFFKHILLPSKSGRTQQEKAYIRQDRREDATKRPQNRGPGAMSMKAKFGKVHKDETENTVLNLSDIVAPLALARFHHCIANHANWGPKWHAIIPVDFQSQCVRSTDDWANPTNIMRVGVVRVNNFGNEANYVIYHCDED